jgi:hypothetical protein
LRHKQLRAAAKALRVKDPGSTKAALKPQVSAARAKFHAIESALADTMSVAGTSFKATRAMEAGIALEPMARDLLGPFLTSQGSKLASNPFASVLIGDDPGLEENYATPGLMTTTDGEVYHLSTMPDAEDAAEMDMDRSALEVKTLDAPEGIARSRDFARQHGKLLRVRADYDMAREAQLFLLQAQHGETGHVYQSLHHAAVKQVPSTVYFHLDGR